MRSPEYWVKPAIGFAAALQILLTFSGTLF
jgi:hypothetical protein